MVANAIDFNSLPGTYVIRPTIGHSSGLVFLMHNSVNLMAGEMCSIQVIKESMADAIAENDKLEFLIEEFLRTEDGEFKIPQDFKFYMFNGKVAGIQVINRMSASKGTNSWYDEDWDQMISITSNYKQGRPQNAPQCLPEMIASAKKLSKAYNIFCRIDFYATDKGAVFGEFTPTPALGKGFTLEGDRLLSNYWDKYCYGLI
jgi:hypothetical protein